MKALHVSSKSRTAREERRNWPLLEVVNSGLCSGCGTCVSLCPQSAVDLVIDRVKGVYIPKTDGEKCNWCGICFKVCPGHSANPTQTNPEETIQDEETELNNVLIGNRHDCYIGHSSNQKTRHDTTSGGLVTQLLVFALEEQIVDGALTIRMNEERPLEPEPFIARTRVEIVSASKSKYCPVPANIALREIRQHEGKFAVVGLPCQIRGIRKAEALDKRLKERIILHMGLFCSHTVNFVGTEILLGKIGVLKQDVKQLCYRGYGWPGHLSVLTKKGERKFIKYRDYWNSLFGPNFFTPLNCLSCGDHTNELADLSFGDPWLKDMIRNDKEGSSIVISRSIIGDEILERAKSARAITLNRIDVKSVVKSQYTSLFSKKIGLGPRMSILKALGIGTPGCSKGRKNANPLLYIVCLLQILDCIASQRKLFQSILRRMPFTFLRVWSACLYYLELLSYKQEGMKYKHVYP